MPICPPGSLTVDVALRVVLANAPLLEAEERAPFDAMGATLAEPVMAPHPHPPFAASIKDGYALRSIDGAGDFDVVDECRAGELPQVSLGERQAVYITTGAPLPPGADCVVQLESVELLEPAPAKRIRVRRAVSAGLEVRPPGFDIAEGSTLLRAGDVLGSAELGLLGYAGWPAVQVRRAARVAVLSTGDELLDPLAPAAHGAGLRGGCVFDSNRPALLAAVLAAGARPIDLGVARDGPAALDAALDAALGAHDADVLVCSGGVSMGDRDLVKPLLARRGATHFGKVWMKPGKPLTFATVPRATTAPGAPAGARAPLLVFGLPGNPVSAYVCFHLVVLPALRQMQGASSPGLRRVAATTVAPIQLDPERPEYHRATLVSGARGWEAHSTGGQISSRLLSCSGADALLELPPAAASLPAGTRVSALLIGDVRSGAGWRHDALPHPIDPLAADGAHAGGGGSGGFRLALVCGADAASSAAAERTSAWLTARLAPDCWQAVRLTLPAEAAADESVCAQALRPLLEGEGTCGLLLLFGATGPAGTGLAAATRALTSRAIPSLGSVLRAACLPHAPAAALLGASCDAALAGSSLLLSLPAAAAAAEAGLAALLPSLPHALAQAGAPGLLRLRSSLSLGR